ncbi:tripeptidyl peptidase A [Dendrothele bispora CBS 962.96]|uniref:tripeptidyl-peptidase II n=1 Tax=Dendrothele bispora (strain CBS 962.96) TaxID=1314807 RepID=A0A4S8MXT7_DENBC|nr:tripeptidyl peptidase A [Dendrothele bispora CBS 962.96]
MHLSQGLFLLSALGVAFAASSTHEVKESVNPPRGWTLHSVAPAHHNIELKIGLPQPNFPILEKHLYEVSDPFHERYGQHLTKEEVEALVAPHQESVDLVSEWLATHDIRESDIQRSPARDWVTIKVPVRLAEKMLDTTYHVWVHDASGDSLVRTTSYSLPKHLHEHVDVIQPTTMFSRWKAHKSTIHDVSPAPASLTGPNAKIDASCNSTITISCLQQLYNVGNYTPSADVGNSIGITGYLEQFANRDDLQTFYAEQRPDAVGTTFNFVSVNGGLNNQSADAAGVEANLDVQFAFGLSFPINSTFFSTGGRPPFIPDIGTPEDTNEPYTEWLDFILAQENPPLAISTSYGDDEQTVPENFARRACAGFAQLGARGVSLMFSSGDGGVGDGDDNPATQTCLTNDGKNQTKFIPGFPASCPFVTAVGGTEFIEPEIAVFFSGGGFSNFFARPAYQDEAVKKFLDTLPPGTFEGLFNPNGRAIPDVAAQGERFRVFLAGEAISVAGTSASSPAFTGIVALLNDVRLKAGKPPLGFLNPLLYTIPEGFNDITIGNNPGCGTEGFTAIPGWDAVTGLGTPNFGKLKDLVVGY